MLPLVNYGIVLVPLWAQILPSDNSMPIIAFGMGSSLEGQLNAPHGGLCIDMSQMNAILQVNGEDLTATVQAGVTREALNQYLRDTGLFPP